MRQALTLNFNSREIDYASVLPAAHNAGNRIYGHDAAQFIAQGLQEAGHAVDFEVWHDGPGSDALG